MKKFIIILVVCLSTIAVAQDKPKSIAKDEAKVVAPTPTTTSTAIAPIQIPSDLQNLIKQADLELANAQLKRQNLDLQLRILLKIPNDFSINGDHYEQVKPPVVNDSPSTPFDKDKTKELKKP